MIFLIEYNRSQGRIINYRTFDEQERESSANARLEIELDLNQRGVDHEVVLLEAESEEALRVTHRRYFEDASQIGRSSSTC
jgi:hypothetical protein